MTTGNTVMTHQQHAQGKPPAKHTAATVATARDGSQPVHHYGPEAVAAMSVIGVVALFGCAAALLLFIKLVRWTFTSKPAPYDWHDKKGW